MLQAFFRAPSGVLGFVMVLSLVLTAILGPILLKGPAESLNLLSQNQTPSWDHIFGTDDVGRDILARTLVATRLSLKIAALATALIFVCGLTLGMATVILGPRLRTLLNRMIDVMIIFPAIIVVVIVSTIIGAGEIGMIIGIGVAGSFRFARLTSTLAMSIGGRSYIDAARVVGVSRLRLMYKHVFPNVADTLVVSLSFQFTRAVLYSASLSFLGLGVVEPAYDWGKLLTQGVVSIYTNPAMALVPAAVLAYTALSVGYFGEALSRAMNPLLWTPASGDATNRSMPGGQSGALGTEVAARGA